MKLTFLGCVNNGKTKKHLSENRADSLCRFFLLWSPDVYGEPGDAESVAKRGFELITEDLEWEEPSPIRRTKPVKKAKGQSGGKKSGDHEVGGEDEDDPLGVTAELAKESWEVQCLPLLSRNRFSNWN